jgi:phosphate transport system permease protein
VPAAMPSMLTGAVLALARAVGETAPLIVVGAVAYVTFLPDALNSPYTALPIQIFRWISRPQAEFVTNGMAAILVLLVVVGLVNATVAVARERADRKVRR